MTRKQLGEIRPRPADHLSALWWLALLYRKPRQFAGAAEALGRQRGSLAWLSLSVHSWPYVVLLCLLVKLALAAALHLPVNQKLIYESLGGIVGGIGVAIGLGIIGRIGRGIAIGIGGGIGFGIVFGIGVGIGGGIGRGIGAGIGLAIPYYGLLFRAYYQPLHWLFVWPHERAGWYAPHPVCWDDVCLLPFPGLDRLLVA